VIVVSNTSPIINLAAVGKLELLRDLYQRILVPEAVYSEITVRGQGQPGALELQTWSCFETRPATDSALVAQLEQELDADEAEAIALAVELSANTLLIDERRGRVVAARFSLPVTGLLGVLVLAKRRGLLTAVKPVLDDLMATAGFYIRGDLYMRVLQSVDEM
jgi:predicted nucleic acid-binding protein